MSVINSIPLIASGDDGYNISRSVRLRSSASASFSRTFGTPTNNKIWTYSAWVKQGALGTSRQLLSGGSANSDQIFFGGTDIIRVYLNSGYVFESTPVYRDPSAWYHIVVQVDTTQATGSNRTRVYVNGLQVTAFSGTPITQNSDTKINSAVSHQIGRYNATASEYFDGYLTEVNFIDGQALTPSSFGETDAVTGVWKPKKYAGTYGTNGFYLNFSDNSNNTATTIGKDYSGNGNNWTPNNISVTSGVTYDSMIDVPTQWADGGNGRGNYCVLNPLDSGATISDGNLTFTGPTGNATTRSSIGLTSGKWYWEVVANAAPAGLLVGIANSSATLSQYLGQNANGWSYCGDGNKYTNASGSAYGATYTTNDVIGVAFDADAGTLVFYKNNTSQGTAFSSLTSGPYFPAVGDGSSGSVVSCYVNFGQRPFAYTPPTGFKALNTQNLPAPSILKGNQYFDVSLYTGTSAAQSIVNGGSMQPDFVWTKARNNASNHGLFDAVRGGSNILLSDSTGAEASGTYISSFNSNGFSVAGNSSALNLSTYTYAAWQWKESATAGLDIVTFTNPSSGSSSFAHNLGVKPSMIIVKSRSNTSNWTAAHKSLGAMASTWLNMDSTAAVQTSSNIWGGEPTSSVFYCGTGIQIAGATMVAYLFAEVAGFSRFGSYTGNGSTDGPFVYCGFRPRYVLVKRTDASGYAWIVMDSSRSTFNAATNSLAPNFADAEYTNLFSLDLLSNGFKWRSAQTSENASGGTFIFAAFAENPFKNSLAR